MRPAHPAELHVGGVFERCAACPPGEPQPSASGDRGAAGRGLCRGRHQEPDYGGARPVLHRRVGGRGGEEEQVFVIKDN